MLLTYCGGVGMGDGGGLTPKEFFLGKVGSTKTKPRETPLFPAKFQS